MKEIYKQHVRHVIKVADDMVTELYADKVLVGSSERDEITLKIAELLLAAERNGLKAII